jgi:hypothetical protein
LKKPAKPLKNPLGLNQARKLTFRDLLEELDEYIEDRHYDQIKEIEEAYLKKMKAKN